MGILIFLFKVLVASVVGIGIMGGCMCGIYLLVEFLRPNDNVNDLKFRKTIQKNHHQPVRHVRSHHRSVSNSIRSKRVHKVVELDQYQNLHASSQQRNKRISN